MKLAALLLLALCAAFAAFAQTPNARVTQVPVEAVTKETTVNMRVTQVPVEAVVKNTTVNMRVTQVAVEVVTLPTNKKRKIIYAHAPGFSPAGDGPRCANEFPVFRMR